MTQSSRRLIHLSRSLGVALLLWGVGALMSEAHAAGFSCTFRSALPFNITLSNVNVVDTLNNDNTTNLPLDCTTPPGVQSVGICVYIGQGGAGGTAANNRFLRNAGGTPIKFAFYSDSGYGSPWLGLDAGTISGPPGSSAYFASGVTSAAGSVSFTIPVRLRIPPGQPQVNGGAYTSSFAAGKIVVYGAVGAASCGALSAGNNSGAVSAAFTITANVVSSCLFHSNNYTLDFGSAGPISTSIRPPVLNIQLDCGPNVNYKVGLDGGLFGGTDPKVRYMYKNGDKNSPHKVLYGLYHNSSYSTGAGFGNNFGPSNADVFSGGSGAAGGLQNIPVYGEVPVQTIPTLGTGLFSDTVNITLSY